MTLQNLAYVLFVGGTLLSVVPTVEAQGTKKTAPAKAADKQAPAVKKSGPATPASVREAIAVVDLRSLATLKDAEFNTQAATRLDGRATGAVKAAAEFYLAQLTKLGWKASTEPNSQMITEDYAQAAVEKSGFVLALSIMPGQMPGLVNVSIMNLGNVDARELPRLADAKLIYGGRGTAMYVSPKKVADVAAETRKLLLAAGWTEYAAPFSQKAVIPDQEMFELRQRGVSMTAYISVAPAQKGQTAIQYSSRMLRQELPAPTDAEALEFDDHRPYLKCLIPSKLAVAVEFYSKAFPEIGYTEKRSVHVSDADAVVVFRSPAQDVVFAQMKPVEGDKVEVTVRMLTAAFIAELNKPAPTKTETKPAVREELYTPVIALPEGAEGVTCPAMEIVQFHLKKSVAESAKELQSHYKAQKWREDTQFSVVTPFTSVLEFKSGQEKLTVLVVPGDDGTSSEITLSGSKLAKKKGE